MTAISTAPGIVLASIAAAGAVFLTFVIVSRWASGGRASGPTMAQIRARILHESRCTLWWPPLGWPSLSPREAPQFTVADARTVVHVHRRCDNRTCSWRWSARRTLAEARQAKP